MYCYFVNLSQYASIRENKFANMNLWQYSQGWLSNDGARWCPPLHQTLSGELTRVAVATDRTVSVIYILHTPLLIL